MRVFWKSAPGLPSDDEATCDVVWIAAQDPLHFGVVFRSELFNVFGEDAVIIDRSLADMVIFTEGIGNYELVIANCVLADRFDLIVSMMDGQPGAYREFQLMRTDR